MSTVLRKGIVRDGQIVIDEPMNLPDGSEVAILGRNAAEPTNNLSDIEFMSEDEQSDDPEAIQQWIADLHSIPPMLANSEREAEWRAWNTQMREFNIEAMRKQFEEQTP